MSKKFLTGLLLAALLIATTVSAASAGGWDVLDIVRSADKTVNALGKITVGTKNSTTSTLPATTNVYYVTGANSFKGIVAVSFDLNNSATTITGAKVSADIPGVTGFKNDYATMDEASSSSFKQVSVDFTISTDFSVPIAITKIGGYKSDSSGMAKTSAVSGELTITPKKFEPKADKEAVSFSTTATSADAVTVSIVSFDHYAFGKSLDMMLVSSDGQLFAIDYAKAINSGDKGSITVSFDKTNGRAKFTPSATGPGAANSTGFKYVFVMGNDVLVINDGNALVAGLSTDVKANRFGEFTVKVTAAPAPGPTPYGPTSDVVYNELQPADYTALREAGITDAAPISKDKFNAVKTTSLDGNSSSLGALSADGNPFGSGSKIVSVDVDGFNLVPITFEVGSNDAFELLAKDPKSPDVFGRSFDIRYQYMDAATMQPKTGDAAFAKLVGNDSGFLYTWADALKDKVVTIAPDGEVDMNYIVKNGTGNPTKAGRFVVVYDNDGSSAKIIDPMWIVEKKAAANHYSSDSGCDAGFGAFALLGLVGVAALIRRKD